MASRNKNRLIMMLALLTTSKETEQKLLNIVKQRKGICEENALPKSNGIETYKNAIDQICQRWLVFPSGNQRFDPM